jgi:hypothetical protein
VVGRDGTRRLVRVPLRAGEAPSAGALAGAVRARARFYALRDGFDPEVAARPDGSWSMRFALHHHGVLRLHVRDTHLGRPKAWLEPDEPLRRWEAMDRGNVARPDEPAAYRVYPDLATLAVRLVGEPDANGANGVATRRYLLAAPAPGFVVEKTLVPDEARPVLGRVLTPEGPEVPSLRGTLAVRELSVQGRVIEHDDVGVEEDGSFVLRTVGEGRYELRAQGPYYTATEPLVVEAGGLAELPGARTRPWLDVTCAPFDPAGSPPRSYCDEAWPDPTSALRVAPDRWHVPLRTAGTCRLYLRVRGSAAEPPREGQGEVQAADAGPTPVAIDLAPVANGTLLVRAEPEALAAGGGATVRVGAGVREATLLPRLAEEARFEHLPVGPWEIEVTWRDAGAAVERRHALVEAEGTTALTVRHRPGGRLVLHGRGPGATGSTKDVMLLVRSDAQGAEPWFVPCARRGPAPLWTPAAPLPAGAYRAEVRGANRVEEVLEFVIEAGRTTDVPFEVR